MSSAARGHFGGLDDPGGPGGPCKMWGAKPATILKRLRGPQGLPDPQNGRVPILKKLKITSQSTDPYKAPIGPYCALPKHSHEGAAGGSAFNDPAGVKQVLGGGRRRGHGVSEEPLHRPVVRAPRLSSRFNVLKNMYFLARPGPRKHPKSTGNGGPGPPRYRRTVLGNHWISKSGWGTGWAPLGCPSQNANFQYKIPSKGQPHRLSSNHAQK